MPQKKWSWKTVTEAIENGKKYLKTNYQIHCNKTNIGPLAKTHSLLFALTDVKKVALTMINETSGKYLNEFKESIEAMHKIQLDLKD